MSPFAERVLEAVQLIPRGKVSTYGLVARHIGSPRAARAVGTVLATHDRMGEIPCHRVVQTSGRLGEYQLGVAKKRELLHNEGIPIQNGIIPNLRDFLYFV